MPPGGQEQEDRCRPVLGYVDSEERRRLGGGGGRQNHTKGHDSIAEKADGLSNIFFWKSGCADKKGETWRVT